MYSRTLNLDFSFLWGVGSTDGEGTAPLSSPAPAVQQPVLAGLELYLSTDTNGLSRRYHEHWLTGPTHASGYFLPRVVAIYPCS